MKRWFGLLGCLVPALLLGSGCEKLPGAAPPNTVAPAKRPPLIDPNQPTPLMRVIGNSTYNFGQMGQQTSDQHTFEISNDGPGELKIRFADTSCGCTSVRFGTVEWMPEEQTSAPATVVSVPVGGKLDVVMTWHSKDRSGEFRTSASFETNDPRQPTPAFTVEGEILPFIEVTETQIKLTGARNTEATTASFYVYSKILDDLEITEVVSSHEKVKTEIEPASQEFSDTVQAKRAFKCKVTVQPGVSIGRFNAHLEVRTNAEQRPALGIDISGEFAGDVIVSPERHNFGHVAAGKGSKVAIFITVRSESDVKVEVKRVVPDFLVARLKQSATTKNRYQLQVEIPAHAPGGEFSGGVELTTDHPTAPSVRIPLHGMIAVPAAGRPNIESP